ncbi:TadE/TadG family type IV pilus assembly protein [Streptomonospora salina]|uniref:TadE-like domain-containing protein n=1 Tax=Streptomonospora salina TaxID=104205 RepID=A0A841EAF2_9ACTN|nr:hypothetical protein [Streptomonospora salina]MBB6000105.1 hypothetical protein [Streptomonospora salina]
MKHPRLRLRGRGDRGAAEAALSLAATFVLVLAVVQVGLWAHAQHRAQAVAEQSLAALRGADATTATARVRAEQARTDLGGHLLRDVDIDLQRGPARARVQVRAEVTALLPGWAPSVAAELSGPVETAGSPP